MIDAYINIMGWCFAAITWAAIVILIMSVLSWAIGWYAAKVFKELRRVYHLRTIGYWLNRLEKGGWREFEKAEKADIQAAKEPK